MHSSYLMIIYFTYKNNLKRQAFSKPSGTSIESKKSCMSDATTVDIMRR